MTKIIENPLDHKFLSVNDVLLVPRLGKLASRANAQLDSFIYSAPMDSVTGSGLANSLLKKGHTPVISRFMSSGDRAECIRSYTRPNAFFAIGFNDAAKFLATAAKIADEQCWPEGTTINLALDIAHGDMLKAHDFTSWLREQPFVGSIMSGSICTPDAALRAVQAGCSHLRVGVGPGAACTTRLMTGCGFPQLSAVYLIYRALENELGGNDTLKKQVKIIADGGIKNPGDAVKYLAAGADGVMMGSVFSKCEESPGWEKKVSGGKWKTYRGQASGAFQKSRYGKAHPCPEGATSKPFKWEGHTVSGIVDYYEGGVRSAISYLGLEHINELKPDNVTFVKVTHSTYVEGTPHGV